MIPSLNKLVDLGPDNTAPDKSPNHYTSKELGFIIRIAELGVGISCDFAPLFSVIARGGVEEFLKCLAHVADAGKAGKRGDLRHVEVARAEILRDFSGAQMHQIIDRRFAYELLEKKVAEGLADIRGAGDLFERDRPLVIVGDEVHHVLKGLHPCVRCFFRSENADDLRSFDHEIPDLVELLGDLKGAVADRRKCMHEPGHFLCHLVDVAETEIRKILVLGDRTDRLHLDRDGSIEDAGVRDEDDVSGADIVDTHTVVDLVTVDEDRVAFFEHDGLAVDGVGHLALRDRAHLDVLVKMRHPLPGDIRLDPALENIGRELRIVVVNDLRTILSLYDQTHDVAIHTIPRFLRRRTGPRRQVLLQKNK